MFLPISFWSKVLAEAIKEWNGIMKEKQLQLKYENLLLQWKGKIKHEEVFFSYCPLILKCIKRYFDDFYTCIYIYK